MRPTLSNRPLAIDLCAGLSGWTDGLLAEGYDVIGFDIERHKYGSHQYPAQLVLQDILTLDGRQFRGKASLIVASPPCQRYSYMAMPWTRAKDLIAWHRDPLHPERITELNALFDACVRIGREAECPIVIENVRGAQPWVGRSRWNYGSFHLWGDVPALMPMTTRRAAMKVGDVGWRRDNDIHPVGFNVMATRQMLADDAVKVGGSRGDDWFTHHNRPEFVNRAIKNSGGSWFNVAHNTTSGTGQNPDGRKTSGHVNIRDGHNHTRHLTNQAESDGVKSPGGGAEGWFGGNPSPMRKHSSKSSARKAASARIAKIPLPLARHIARVYYPSVRAEVAV